MSLRSNGAATRDTSSVLKVFALEVALAGLGCGAPQFAAAQDVPAFAPGMINHMQQMKRFKDADHGQQPTPPVIPRFSFDPDPTGAVVTFQPNGATFTFNNAFFQNLGTNGRTCFSCHQPQDGWGVSAADVASRFATSGGTDPIFRVRRRRHLSERRCLDLRRQTKGLQAVDRQGFDQDRPAGPGEMRNSSSRHVDDPYNCNTNPVTGLTSPTAGIVSTYRRPLPSTNLGFLSAIMWDGREPSLSSQATDATLGHAQASTPPTAAQLAEIIAFESGIFAAQAFDDKAGNLATDGSTGGPVALSLQLANFFIGVNDPLGHNPQPDSVHLPDLRSVSAVAGPARARRRRATRIDRARRGGIQQHQHQHHRGFGPQRRSRRREHSGILRHLPRHAQCGQSLGQGAARHRHSRRRRQQAAGPRHFGIAGVHADVHARPAGRPGLQGH